MQLRQNEGQGLPENPALYETMFLSSFKTIRWPRMKVDSKVGIDDFEIHNFLAAPLS